MKSFLLKARAYAAAFIFLGSIMTVAVPDRVWAFGGGDGTEGDPYQIVTCADFMDIMLDYAAHYVLMNNLDCTSDGSDVLITGDQFSGVFDGNENEITYSATVAGGYSGLFSEVSGTIRDVTVHGTLDTSTSDEAIGIVVGNLNGGTVTNVDSTGSITAADARAVGGVIGQNQCSSTISNVSSTAIVVGGYDVGGIVGLDGCEGPGGTYSNITANGATVTGIDNVGGMIGTAYYADIREVEVTSAVSGQLNVGGLVGVYDSSGSRIIFHASASGDVDGTENVGGLVGYLEGTVSQSYATGAVTTTAGDNAGGLVGYLEDDGSVRDSYARGSVDAVDGGTDDAGGLIGESEEGAFVTTSYATGAVQSPGQTGGIIGNNSTLNLYATFFDEQTTGFSDGCGVVACGTARSTAQMKTQATFTDMDWNFDEVWDIDSGQNDGYPILVGGEDQLLAQMGSGNPVETILDENQFHGTGEPQGWNEDDDYWEYELPFTFTFYGEDYESVFVSSNGYVTFGDGESDYDFEVSQGVGLPVIIAVSGDLDTDCGNEGEDIYIDDNGTDTVIIRWLAGDHRECSTVLNFEIVLHSDGSFEINYGDMNADLDGSGAVGVNSGNGAFRLSAYNGTLNFDNLNTSAWNYSDEDDEPAVDSDDDGIAESEEDDAPNGGDANDDGIADSEQPKVTSLKSEVSDAYVVLESATCAGNQDVTLTAETAHSATDEGYQYPAGLLNFTLTGCGVGASETVTQYYFGSYDITKLVLRKYDETNNSYTTVSGAAFSSVTVGGQAAVKVVYTVVDGGELDQDGTANGEIVDPAGIAVLAAVTAPQTGLASAQWFHSLGLLLAGASVMLVAARATRHQNK